MPSERSIYEPHPVVFKNAHCFSFEQYQDMHQHSIDNPEEFWGKIAQQFYWKTPFNLNTFFDFNFDVAKGPIYTKWLEGATTNVSYNLLDRNVENGHGDRVAFLW